MNNEHTDPPGFRLGPAAEIAFALLLIAFGCLCIDTTVPDTINFMVVEYLDSTLYSQLVGALLVVSALYQGVEAFRKRRAGHLVPRTMLVGLLLTFAYVLGFAYVGFYTSTFLFLFGYSLIIEPPAERNVTTKLAFAALAVGILYGAFSAFKIYLPTAWLF